MIDNCKAQKSREMFILLIIVLVGLLIRFPIGNIGNVDITILNDPDSYLYARRAVELYEMPIDKWTVYTSRSADSLMSTIDEVNDPFTTNLLPMIAALICKIFNNISIEFVIYYVNLFFCAITVFPTYFFVSKYTNNVGGLVAAFSIITAPAYFMHTIIGFFDTDAIIMFFAVSIVTSAIEMIIANSKREQIKYSLIVVTLLILFSFAWEAYYAYALIVVGIVAFTLVFVRISKYKCEALTPYLTVASILAFCLVTSGDAAKGSLGRTISTFLHGSEWPDEAKYIGELTIPKFMSGGFNNSFLLSPVGVVNWLGGLPCFLFMTFSIILFVYFLFKKKNTLGKDLYIVLLTLVLWIIFTFPIVAFGVRFIQFVAVPLSLAMGICVGLLIRHNDFEIKGFKKDLIVTLGAIITFGAFLPGNMYMAFVFAMGLLIVGICINKIQYKRCLYYFLSLTFICILVNEFRLSYSVKPYVSRDIVDSAEYLNKNTSEECAVISWWNIGYYLQYETGRQTVADGGIYDGAYFYWLANVFATEDEELSSGICRMLQSGSIEAVTLIQNATNSATKTVEILKEILVLDAVEAKHQLVEKYKFNVDFADDILYYTHPNEVKEMYIVFYDDLKEIVAPIAYFGLWDFNSEKTYSTTYIVDKKEYEYPEEMKNSIVVKYLTGHEMPFEEVYSNNTVSIYKIF